MKYKMVIVVRKDIKMSIGKTCAQVAHAAVELSLKANKEILKKWLEEGGKKVVLYVNSLEELLELKEKAERLGINNVLIIDRGLTEVKEGTITCLGLGPDEEEKIDKVTGHLPLLKD